MVEVEEDQQLSELDWKKSAVDEAWAMGCNPGGEVGIVRIDQNKNIKILEEYYPYNRLLGRSDIARAEELMKGLI